MAALVVYIASGNVLYVLGLVASAFSLLGNYLGTVSFYKKGSKLLPRYTSVEYELNVVGFAEANANPLSGKSVTVVRDSKGKRMIIEKKGTDAAVAAVGIGIPVVAALGYWFIHKRKK